MTDSTTMSTPVTRGELLDALAQFRQDFRADLLSDVQAAMTQAIAQAIAQAVAPLATRAELELWGGALLARIQQTEHQLRQEIRQTETRLYHDLYQDLARHVSAAQETLVAQIAASTEPFVGLPDRVRRLEDEVFGAPPSRRRTQRRSR